MKRQSIHLFFMIVFSLNAFSQETNPDDKYFEDQFYMGLSYNFLLNKPMNVAQSNLSYGLQAGFIKDIPVNYNRTVAIGIGVGYSVNSYYTNVLATNTDVAIEYDFIDADLSYKRNKLETHLIEFPVEIRWRDSNAQDYNFWRVYGGFKLGYAFANRSKFVSQDAKTTNENTDLAEWHYGLMLNFGYHTWNIHLYYGLNQIFNSGVALENGSLLEMQPLRVGVIFYIL